MNFTTKTLFLAGVVGALVTLSAGAGDTNALRRAILDLSASYPSQYSRGAEFLKRLDAVTNEESFLSLQREALLSNPLLDFDKILVVRRGAGNLGLPHNWDSNCVLPQRGYDNEIAVLSLSNLTLQTLFKPQGGVFVGDVDLHFDADKMLFSMPNGKGRWHVWQVNADGGGLRQITPEEPDVDQYDPCYLPDGGILFDSTATFVGVPCVFGSSSVANLFRMEPDGKTIRRLCFDQENDWCPTVLSDGSILYSRWEYSDLPHSNSRRLFRMNPDGTNQRLFYGTDSYFPNSFFYARPIPGQPAKVVGVASGHHGTARSGRLLIMDVGEGRGAGEGLVQEIPGFGKPVKPIVRDRLVDGVWPQFLHPYPLSDKYFLVSCRPAPQSPWGVYLVDIFDNRVLLYEQPGQAILEPVPFRKIPPPPVMLDRTDAKQTTATVLLTDVYRGAGLPGIPRGAVKKLRVVEYYFSPRHMGGLLGVLGVDGPWDMRRVLGTVPVEEDGSALFFIPAQTSIMVQPLDEKGQALQVMRSWFVGMPGERLSCVGCHEKQNESPSPAPSIAARRGVPSLIEPPDSGAVRGFNFAREVQPVLDKYCVSCHGAPELADAYAGSKPGDRRKPYLKGDRMINDYRSQIAGSGGGVGGGKFSMAYAELHRFVRRPGIEGDMRTLSPMDYHFSSTELGQMLRVGHHGVKIDAASWARLAMWSDLNAPYHGTWHEIVGDRARAAYGHIQDMRKKYAPSGPNPDNEEIPPLPSFDATPVVPVAGPVVKPGPVVIEVAQSALESRSFDLGDGVKLDMVRVPGGTLGGVPFKSFWIGTCEVMNGQFRCFDANHDSRDESRHGYQFGRLGYGMNGDRQPTVRVSFDQAQAFCRWLSAKTGKPFDLPLESQWEWACRAGTTTPYYFGGLDSDYSSFANLGDRKLKAFAACTARDNYSAAVPLANPGRYDDWIPRDDRFDDGGLVSMAAGSYKPNGWGLFDMIGNVWEWTRSPYAPGDLSERAVRGGSWYDRPFRCTATARLPYRTYQRVFNVGFRVMFEDDSAPAAVAPSAVQTSVGHRFLCGDYVNQKVCIVGTDGKVEWQYDGAGTCDEVWALSNGNILFNTGHGVKEVTRDKKVVFEYKSDSEVYACQRLPNGNTFIGECTSGRLLQVTPDGKIASEIHLLPPGTKAGHTYMRNVRVMANGHILVAHMGGQMVREYDATGKTVREIPAPGGPHSAIPLVNGNILIATGDIKCQEGPRVFEVDPAGKTVWEVKNGDLPGIQFAFMTGLHRLPNGNTLMSNWVGHGKFGTAPHLIEVTPDKKVVWTFADHKAFRTIASVQVLDCAGNALDGSLQH